MPREYKYTPREFRLETPAEITRRAVRSETAAIEAFGRAHPYEWFIAREGYQHRSAGRVFMANAWERKYRVCNVKGVKVHKAYLRYVGPT